MSVGAVAFFALSSFASRLSSDDCGGLISQPAQAKEGVRALQVQASSQGQRLDLVLGSQQLAAMCEGRLHVATRQPALHRLALDRRPARGRKRVRAGAIEQALDRLERRQIAVGLQVEIRQQLEIGQRASIFWRRRASILRVRSRRRRHR